MFKIANQMFLEEFIKFWWDIIDHRYFKLVQSGSTQSTEARPRSQADTLEFHAYAEASGAGQPLNSTFLDVFWCFLLLMYVLYIYIYLYGGFSNREHQKWMVCYR